MSFYGLSTHLKNAGEAKGLKVCVCVCVDCVRNNLDPCAKVHRHDVCTAHS